MTPEAQRIAIAEACGWTDCHCYSLASGKKPCGRWMGQLPTELPDYLNDLNAMHEAEKVLSEERQRDYCRNILESFDKNRINWRTGRTLPPTQCWITAHATAAQRAEAFLKTLNLWKE